MRLKAEELNEIVEREVAQEGKGALGPAIKKELIHYLLFDYLDASGFLDELVFQGGTCLRDCYGAVRLSEDLDFNVPRAFDVERLGAMTDGIRKSLHRSLGTEVTVTPPRRARMDPDRTVPIAKWMVAVETEPGRPDIPRQRVKIEVAQIPAYRVEDRFLQVHYDELPSSLGDILVVSESLEEICADKIVSFALSPYLRFRDVWDLQWLNKQRVDLGIAAELVERKLADYNEPVAIDGVRERGIGRIAEALEDPAIERELIRFLGAQDIAHTVARPRWRAATAKLLEELYEKIG